METKLNRIIIRENEYTNTEQVSKLIADAGVTTEFNIERLTVMCNALGKMVEDDDKGHVDLFVQKKSDDHFLCANLYTVYLSLNNVERTLPAFQTIIDAAHSMICRAVDEDVMVLQLRFRI